MRTKHLKIIFLISILFCFIFSIWGQQNQSQKPMPLPPIQKAGIVSIDIQLNSETMTALEASRLQYNLPDVQTLLQQMIKNQIKASVQQYTAQVAANKAGTAIDALPVKITITPPAQ